MLILTNPALKEVCASMKMHSSANRDFVRALGVVNSWLRPLPRIYSHPTAKYLAPSPIELHLSAYVQLDPGGFLSA